MGSPSESNPPDETIAEQGAPLPVCRYIAVGIALLALVMPLLAYYNLATSIFDLGVYDHLAWRFAAYGDWLPSLAGHFRPITLVYGLFYKLAPHPFTLIVLQWLAAVGAGILFYRLAQHLLDTRHADLLILLYALNPLVLYQVFWDFHADHLIVLTFFGMFYILITRERLRNRDRMIVIGLCLVSWLLKEPLVLSVAFMGLFIALYKRQEWKLGLGIFFASLLAFHLITSVLWPLLRGHEADLGGNYENLNSAFGYLGSSIREASVTLFTEPTILLGGVFNDMGKAYYVAALLLPVAFLPLLSPLALVPAIPAVAIALLSTNPNHYAPVHHYTASVVAPLFVGLLFTLQRLRQDRACIQAPYLLKVLHQPLGRPYMAGIAMVIGTAFVAWAYSPLPGGRFFFKEDNRYHYSRYLPSGRNEHIKQALEPILAQYDPQSISIQNSLMYHPLLHRENYHLFPRGIDEAELIVLDTKRPPYIVDNIQPEQYRALLDGLKATTRIVYNRDGLVVMRPAALPHPTFSSRYPSNAAATEPIHE